jgi:hypothetical protein
MVPTVRPSTAYFFEEFTGEKTSQYVHTKKYHDIPRGVTFAAFEQIDTMDFNNLYIS